MLPEKRCFPSTRFGTIRLPFRTGLPPRSGTRFYTVEWRLIARQKGLGGSAPLRKGPMRSIQETFQLVPTSADKGLTPDAVERSRQQFGNNRLTPLPREPLWKKFLEKFDEPIIKILLAAALLSMIVDLFKQEPAPDGTPEDNTRYLVGGIAVGGVVLAV